jgi:hypothetical protein
MADRRHGPLAFIEVAIAETRHKSSSGKLSTELKSEAPIGAPDKIQTSAGGRHMLMPRGAAS